ncbi:MAG: glycosyltransferase family 39 protein [Chloroflexota bacterium]
MKPPPKHPRGFSWTLWLVIVASCALLGLALLAFSIIPYGSLKASFDRLTPDGNLESFTPQAYAPLVVPTRLIGLFLLLLSSVSFGLRRLIQGSIQNLAQSLKKISIKSDLQGLREAIKPTKSDRAYLFTLLAITLMGAGIRMLFLSIPMGHDEAYTFIAFASRPVRYIISDYHLPNNHVFHSLLVHGCYYLLGNQPWVVRLPAFLSGVLLVPACCVSARMIYDRNTALVSAALVASTPTLIEASTSARGYTLICLITMTLLALAAFLKQHRNCLAWGLFVVLSALGFYTIPIMLYPFGILITWLLLSALVKDIGSAYGSGFIKYLLITVLSVAVLCYLLYLPIFLHSGIGSVIGNNFVQPLEWSEFQESIIARSLRLWSRWTDNIPPVVAILSIIGLLTSMLFHKRLTKHRVPLVIAALLWIGVVLLIQRVAPWSRIWLFILPIYLILASAGIIGLFTRLKIRTEEGKSIPWVITGAVLILALGFYSMHTNPPYTPGETGSVEEITLFLKGYLQPGDVVITKPPLGAIVVYYFDLHHISEEYFLLDRDWHDFQQVIVIVDEGFDQTIDQVLQKKGLECVDKSSAKMIHQYGKTKVYELTIIP